MDGGRGRAFAFGTGVGELKNPKKPRQTTVLVVDEGEAQRA